MYVCMHIHIYIYTDIYVYDIFFNDIYVVFISQKRMANLAFEGAEASEEDLQVAEGEAKAEP